MFGNPIQTYAMNILAFFKINEISEDHIDKIRTYLKPITIKKGQNFCERGKNVDRLGILIDGLLVAKYENEYGDEFISRFYHISKNGIVSNHYSFLNKKAATETIQARVDSMMMVISRDDLNNLIDELPEIQKHIAKWAEISYVHAIQRIHDLQSLNAEQRIGKFVRENKELLTKVSKSDMASYLGMNRNRFSNLLKRIQ